jgi:hypothetical protein
MHSDIGTLDVPYDKYQKVFPTRWVSTAVDDDAMDKNVLKGLAKNREGDDDLLRVTLFHAIWFDERMKYALLGVYDVWNNNFNAFEGRSEDEPIHALVEDCRKKGKFKELRDLGSSQVYFRRDPGFNMTLLFRDPLARSTTPCKTTILYK